MSIMSRFQQDSDSGLANMANNYTAMNQRTAAAMQPPPDDSVFPDGRTADDIDAAARLKQYDYSTIPRPAWVPPNGSTVPQTVGPLPPSGRVPYVPRYSNPDLSAGQKFAQGIADLGTYVIDPPFRAANTAIAGTQLLFNAATTPRGRARLAMVDGDPTDAITFGDLGDIYRKSWDTNLTAGQAIATTYGDFINLAVNIAGPQYQKKLDDYINADTASRMTDATNERKLGSWMSGLRSDFDVFNEVDKDSAYGQGVGRWVTGGTDAALALFVGIDVLAAKGAAAAVRGSTTVVLSKAGGRGAIDVDQFAVDAYAHFSGSRKTAAGELIDSIYAMTPEQAAMHDIVLASDNPALAADLFGTQFNSRKEALDTFLAAFGSVKHAKELMATRTDLYDKLVQANSERDFLRWVLDNGADYEMAYNMGEAEWAMFGVNMNKHASHLDNVADAAKTEYERLRDMGAFVTGRFQDEVVVKQLIGSKIHGYSGRSIRIAKKANRTGKYSASRMDAKAQARLSRFTGSAYEDYYFKMFGRPIRFVTLRSGLDYLGRHRQTGVLNFQDHGEFMREFESALSTAPFLRRAAKAKAGDPRRLIERRLDDGTIVTESVEEFRTRWLKSAIEASRGTPKQKAEFAEKFEMDMADALGQYLSHKHGTPVTRGQIIEAAQKYVTKRSIVQGHMKNHNWLTNDTEMVVLDETVLSTQRNGYTLMDFKWLENSYNLYASNPFTKGAAASARGFATVLDQIWRPLVLLRLGYTQRNLAEGYLRTLAAFGEIPTSGELGTSSKYFLVNSGDRLAGGVNRFKNSVLKRKGLRKVRKQIQRTRGILDGDIKTRNDGIDRARAAATEVERIRKKAREEAQQVALERERRRLVTLESPVYEAIADDLTEEQLRFYDTADSVIYNEGDVNSVMARGLLEPDLNTGVGVADAEALTRKALGEDAVDFGDEYDSLYSFMTPRQQAAYDEFAANNYDESTGQWVSEEAALQDEEFKRDAYFRRLNQLYRADYRIGRINASGEFKVIRSDQLGKITYEDFASGSIVAVPKGVKPQYAKVDVYGGVLDLRTNVAQETLKVREEVSVARSAMSRFDDFNNRRTENTSEEANDLSSRLGRALGSLFGDAAPVAAVDIDSSLRMLETSPEILRGIALKRWIDANADTLPDGFIEWATKKRLILTNPELKRMIARSKKLDSQSQAASLKRDELKAWLENNDNWPEDAVLHAGRDIEDDVLKDVLINERTMQTYLYGPGLYSINGAPNTSRGYLFAHVDGQADIDRAGAAATEPIVYIMPDPADYAWINLEDLVRLDDGSLNPVVQDMIQLLDSPDFPISTGTLGNFMRIQLEDGSFEQTFEMMNRNATISDLWNLARRNIMRGEIDQGTPDEVMYKAIDALRNGGYDGLMHKSGGESKDVYIWWAKDVPLTRLDNVSDNALEYMNQARRASDLRRQFTDNAYHKYQVEENAPYGGNTMRTVSPQPGGGFIANTKLEQLLVQYAKERGYGKVLVDDPSTVEGYRALFVPDMMATNQGYVDSLVPGQVAKAGRGQALVMDLSSNQGAGSAAAINREALEQFDPQLANAVFRNSMSNQDRAKLALYLQDRGYTHLLLPAGKNKEPVLFSASELIGSTKSGLAYARLGLGNDIDEIVASRLAKDEGYAKAMADLEDARRIIKTANANIGITQATLKDLAAALDQTRPTAARRRVVTGGADGEKKIEITGISGKAKLETGEVLSPNEAQSGQYASLASSGGFHDLLLVGYMQNRYAQYERSYKYVEYKPDSELYWLSMSTMANDLIRQDPIMRRLATMPKVQLSDEAAIEAQNEALIPQLMADDAFRSGANSGLYDLNDLPAEINKMREKLYSWIPDEEVLSTIGKQTVTPDYLASRMAWRDDLVGISERELTEMRGPMGIYRKFVNRAMNTLGTLPEDTLLRHPFYRKRWMEEMQEQVNEYERNGFTEFTQAQIDAMRRSAHDFALKTTRQTLYTVTRLSTPAAALGLFIPFFPAWENALRFWTKSFAARPENLMRYVQVWNAPNAMGMVVDQDGNPIEAKRGIAGLPDALFTPGGAQIRFFLPTGVTEKIPPKPDFLPDAVPWIGVGTKGEVRISKGALNVALQGDYPWLTNAGPMISAPLSYIAAQKPDYTQAILDWKPGGVPIGEAMTKTVIPFGRPTAEKSILSALYEQYTPATLQRMVTAFGGFGDAEFVATAEEIRRDMTIDWERGGRQGPEPTMAEATARAREFYALRFVTNFVAFAAPSYQSKYQGEVEEWRRISAKNEDIKASYEKFNIPLPEDRPVGYMAALREFLDLHGKEFFYATQSSSGRSGVGASVPEYKILDTYGDLASNLAGDGTDDWVAMITSPYADEFSYPVYAWQMNRMYDNSTTVMRGGNPEDIIVKSRIARGWIRYRDGMNGLEAIAEERGVSDVSQDPQLAEMKKILIADIASENPEWEIQKGKFDQMDWKVMLGKVEMILNNDQFMKDHGSEPLWIDVKDWYDRRNEIGQLIIQRKKELGDSGSLNINSSSNADIKVAWEAYIADKKRTNLAFADFYNRFLDYDTLLPGDPRDRIVLQSDYLDPMQFQADAALSGMSGGMTP